MLARKHIELIASEIYRSKECTSGFSEEYNAGRNGALNTLAEFLAIQFAKENPSFRRDKFLNACGL